MKKPDHSKQAKRGHPAFVPTDAQRQLVAKLIAMRMQWDEIRLLIINPRTGDPITKSTLNRHFKRELAVGANPPSHCSSCLRPSTLQSNVPGNRGVRGVGILQD